MSNMPPSEMAKTLAKGLLSFPVTHFDKDFQFQEGPYREHCAWLLSFKRLTGLFAAGGTGEFFSLTPPEVGTVRHRSGERNQGPDPGDRRLRLWHRHRGGAGQVGREGRRRWPPAAAALSDGALQEGLMAHVEAVCKATSRSASSSITATMPC